MVNVKRPFKYGGVAAVFYKIQQDDMLIVLTPKFFDDKRFSTLAASFNNKRCMLFFGFPLCQCRFHFPLQHGDRPSFPSLRRFQLYFTLSYTFFQGSFRHLSPLFQGSFDSVAHFFKGVFPRSGNHTATSSQSPRLETCFFAQLSPCSIV